MEWIIFFQSLRVLISIRKVKRVKDQKVKRSKGHKDKRTKKFNRTKGPKGVRGNGSKGQSKGQLQQKKVTNKQSSKDLFTQRFQCSGWWVSGNVFSLSLSQAEQCS